MENKAIARSLRLLGQLMELHGENSFRIKTISSAAYVVDKLPYSLANNTLAEIEKIPSVGKNMAGRIWELLQTGKLQELETLIQQTPPGIMEIMTLKGLGPKKILTIWKDLGIENMGELFYACNENRLVEARGFGLKTQEEIKKAIEFKMASLGRFLFARLEEIASPLLNTLKQILPEAQIALTGQYRRKCEIIDHIDFLIGTPQTLQIVEKIKEVSQATLFNQEDNVLECESDSGIKIHFIFSGEEQFGRDLAYYTGSAPHIEELSKRLEDPWPESSSEEEIYQKAGLPFIEPELREGIFEFDMAAKGPFPQLLTFADLRGALHNHSTWSDGMNTIEEMALYCRDELHLEYLGITDHSRSAFYAKGLSEERVLAQHAEIEALNRKLSPFRIFKGIESDILFDGSLDYPSEILSRFDFVVASIHSVFRMDEKKATDRLIKAIENPFTTILGHPTGRLLLSRKGYPVDIKKVIDACAANQTIIEINANPLRLDLDWHWHQYAIEKNVLLSVNPDAHSNRGFHDMHYGVLAARKGGVSAKYCLNTLSREAISNFFTQRRRTITT